MNIYRNIDGEIMFQVFYVKPEYIKKHGEFNYQDWSGNVTLRNDGNVPYKINNSLILYPGQTHSIDSGNDTIVASDFIGIPYPDMKKDGTWCGLCENVDPCAEVTIIVMKYFPLFLCGCEELEAYFNNPRKFINK